MSSFDFGVKRSLLPLVLRRSSGRTILLLFPFSSPSSHFHPYLFSSFPLSLFLWWRQWPGGDSPKTMIPLVSPFNPTLTYRTMHDAHRGNHKRKLSLCGCDVEIGNSVIRSLIATLKKSKVLLVRYQGTITHSQLNQKVQSQGQFS